MAYDDRKRGVPIWLRILRALVPWVALGLVITVLWSIVTDYRAAAESTPDASSVETSSTTTVTEGTPYVRVLSDGLNLRAEPSTTAAIVKVLAADQQLVFVEEGIGWYRVRDADGTEGWVAAGGRYTELVQP